jgi:hypothetical protein
MKLIAFAALLALASTSPASAEPTYSCNATMQLKGWLTVTIDPKTLRGTIERVTAGKALQRDIRVSATVDGDTLSLIFRSYGPKDSTTIRGKRGPRPRNEKLKANKSVVARLVTSNNAARLYVDGAVDFTTDSGLVVQDGYSACRP